MRDSGDSCDRSLGLKGMEAPGVVDVAARIQTVVSPTDELNSKVWWLRSKNDIEGDRQGLQ